MSAPAFVKIAVLKINGIPAAAPGTGNSRYARATFQAGSGTTATTGRSRPIPDAAGDFDLAVEGIPWRYEARVGVGTDIVVSVELLEDHGDMAAPAPVKISGAISDPWRSGTRILAAGPSIEVQVT